MPVTLKMGGGYTVSAYMKVLQIDLHTCQFLQRWGTMSDGGQESTKKLYSGLGVKNLRVPIPTIDF